MNAAGHRMVLMLLAGLGAVGAVVSAAMAPDRLFPLLFNTTALTAVTLALVLPLGIVLAVLLYRTDMPAAASLRTVVVMAMFVPLAVYAGVWQAVLDAPARTNSAEASATALLSAALIHVIAALPWTIFIVGNALRSVEPELEQQALLDASPVQVMRSVTLRRAAAGVGAAAGFVAVSTVGDITVTDLMQVRTYAEEVYTYFTLQGAGSAPTLLGVPGMLLLGVLFSWATIWLLNLSPKRWELIHAAPNTFAIGRRRRWIAGLVMFVLLAPMAVVLSSLIAKAGMTSTMLIAGAESDATPRDTEGLADRFSRGQNFREQWQAQAAITAIVGSVLSNSDVLMDTLVIGVSAAVLCVCVSLPLAWQLRVRPALAPWTGIVLGVCLAVPGPVIGLAFIHLFNRPGPLGMVYDSKAIVVLGQTFRLWPFVFLAVWGPICLIPRAVFEMAALDGAGYWRQARSVLLPLSGPAVRTGLLVGFALSLGELSVAVLLEPPGTTTLSIRIFQFLHFGMDRHLAGITLLLAGLSLVVGCVITIRKRS